MADLVQNKFHIGAVFNFHWLSSTDGEEPISLDGCLSRLSRMPIGAMSEHVRGRRFRENKKWKSIIKLLRDRELGSSGKVTKTDVPFASARIPHIWSKRYVNPGFRNKIFASQWVTNNDLVYGTKCNQLVLFDTVTNEGIEIPLICSDVGCANHSASTACGIHSIQKNPSQTLLATGGHNVNEVGVYKLSELSPYCLLKDCHKDWVFDLRWIDDSYLASCSRDSSLALWHIPTYGDDNRCWQPTYGSSIHMSALPLNSIPVITKPVAHMVSSLPDDRFRAVEHVAPFNLLAVVSMSRRLYMYDAVRMGSDSKTRPVFTLVLRDAYQEAVALRSWPSDPRCIALATHHCVVLFDIRCSNPVNASGRCIHPPQTASGVRSLNFSGDILSYGSSKGQVRFYDLRAAKHLPMHLDVGPGWVKPFDCDAGGEDSNTFDTLPPASGDNWPPQNHSTYPSWNTPPPSPLQSFFMAPSTSSSSSLFTRTNNFVSQVNNLRVRLDRIQNRLSGLSNRRLAMASASLIYSIAGLRVPTVGESVHESTSNDIGYTSDPNSDDLPRSSTNSGADATRSDDIDENDGVNTGPFEDTTTENHDDSASPDPGTRLTYHLDGLNSDWRSFISIPPILFTDFDHRRLTAVYTHEYDPSGTRLFTAGGPIASTCHGNVAALWE